VSRFADFTVLAWTSRRGRTFFDFTSVRGWGVAFAASQCWHARGSDGNGGPGFCLASQIVEGILSMDGNRKDGDMKSGSFDVCGGWTSVRLAGYVR